MPLAFNFAHEKNPPAERIGLDGLLRCIGGSRSSGRGGSSALQSLANRLLAILCFLSASFFQSSRFSGQFVFWTFAEVLHVIFEIVRAGQQKVAANAAQTSQFDLFWETIFGKLRSCGPR